MAGRLSKGSEAPIEDQEWYIRENAVAIVRDKDRLIARLRARVRRLERSVNDLREFARKHGRYDG